MGNYMEEMTGGLLFDILLMGCRFLKQTTQRIARLYEVMLKDLNLWRASSFF
jgi:hypothetical protein